MTRYISASIAMATSQSEWYLDSVNGNNANSGLAGFPLKDETELVRRIFPNQTRLILTQDVTVYMASGDYFNCYFGVGSNGEEYHTLTIVCQTTNTPLILLSGVVNTLAPTVRGRLTTLSGGFTSRKRIRLTSGAHTGAVAYSSSLDSTLNTFVSGFVIPTTDAFHIFSGAAPGDNCVEETLTVRMLRAEFDAGPWAKIVVKDARIIRAVVNGVAIDSPSGDAGGNVTFSGCEAAGVASVWQCNSGGANLFGCVVTGKTVFSGFGWLNWGSVNRGLMSISNGSMSSYGLMIDGGVLTTNVEFNFERKSNQGASRFTAEQSYNGTGTIEVENGGNAYGIGACIDILCGGEFVNAGRGATQAEIWGLSNPYAIGFNVEPGGHIYQTDVNSTGDQFLDNFKIPSATNLRVGQNTYAYSKTARPDPTNNCGFQAANYI